MNSIDTNGKFIGSCSCFPKEGEEHYFGDVLYKFKETRWNGCYPRFVFERR